MSCTHPGCDKPLYIILDSGILQIVDGKKKQLPLRYAYCEEHVHRILDGEWPLQDGGPGGDRTL